jgi:hypothetical protein
LKFSLKIFLIFLAAPFFIIGVLAISSYQFVKAKIPRRKRHRAVRAMIYFDGNEEIQMGKILKVGEGVGASVVFKDKNGNVAKVDGKPNWAFDQAEVADLSVSDDGMSAFLKAKAVGAGKLQVSADADLGEGIVTIIGEADLIVEAEQAEVVEISFGDVVPPA